MSKRGFKWGVSLNSNYGAFLLGANIHIGKYNKGERYGYITIYLGFKTVVVGKDYF
ncbi:MAG: hypothetical protein K0Q47_107 [Sedimentibacter sp.]|nr:hypothetical protein [Sedimentibacter sp.]